MQRICTQQELTVEGLSVNASLTSVTSPDRGELTSLAAYKVNKFPDHQCIMHVVLNYRPNHGIAPWEFLCQTMDTHTMCNRDLSACDVTVRTECVQVRDMSEDHHFSGPHLSICTILFQVSTWLQTGRQM